MEPTIVVVAVAVLVSSAAIGAVAVFIHFASYLVLGRTRALDRPHDAGSIGRLRLAIPERGVGSVVLAGRSAMPARSMDGRALPSGALVVVVETEARIAIVEPLELEE